MVARYDYDWFDYHELPQRCQAQLSDLIGVRLLDIKGFFDDDEWEPDYEIILVFEGRSVVVSTSCDYLWALEPCHDEDAITQRYAVDPDPEGYIPPPEWADCVLTAPTLASIVDAQNLHPLIGQALTGFSWDITNKGPYDQNIRLEFQDFSLLLHDDGDRLGIMLLRRGSL